MGSHQLFLMCLLDPSNQIYLICQEDKTEEGLQPKATNDCGNLLKRRSRVRTIASWDHSAEAAIVCQVLF